jgi:hypothetical protein
MGKIKKSSAIHYSHMFRHWFVNARRVMHIGSQSLCNFNSK